MSTLLKNIIIDKLNATNWSNNSDNDNATKGFDAIIDGIYDYMNGGSPNVTFTGSFTGIQATTPTPTPVTGISTHTLHIVNTSWLNTFKTTVFNGVSTGGIQRIFQGIQTMLLGTVPPGLALLPPLGTPLVPVVFPSMVSFGIPCELEILGAKPTTKEDAWIIISKYIQQGLSINVVPPMPTSGVITFPVTGLTTGILVFN
jgi:hypothetical protein